MNKEIRTYENKEFGKLRAFSIGTKIYFSANDVCKLLGFKSRRQSLARHIDHENIITATVCDIERKTQCLFTSGLEHQQVVVAIDKIAVKILAYASKKKNRLQILNWILKDVSSAAEKYVERHPTDMYGLPIESGLTNVELEQKPNHMHLPALHEPKPRQSDAFVFPDVKEEKTFGERLFDMASEEGNTYTTDQIALELLRTAAVLNQELETNEIQFLHKGKWHLYPQYSDKGLIRYESVKALDSAGNSTRVHVRTWTERGRYFLHGLMSGEY